MERQVLKGVQRVVMDEDADRALVGQHRLAPVESARSIGRPAGQRDGVAPQCPPPACACGQVDADDRHLDVAVLGIFHERRQHFLDVVVDVLAGAVDHHLLAVVDFFEGRATMPGLETNVPSRRKRIRHDTVIVAHGDDRALGVLVEHEARCRRRCRRSRPSASRAPAPRRW